MPGELSGENLISSHVKITCYLHMWKYHRCYGYIIYHAFHTKKLLKRNGLVAHWCLYNKINRTLHGCLEIWNFSSRIEKNISLIHCIHLWNIFQHSKKNFVSPRGHVISSISTGCVIHWIGIYPEDTIIHHLTHSLLEILPKNTFWS